MISPEPKHIALVAHDDRKGDLLEWAEHNRDILASHVLYATGTTGQMLGDRLDLPVTCSPSGPLGGDQQIGALIASGDLDMLVFFWDPMSPSRMTQMSRPWSGSRWYGTSRSPATAPALTT